MKYALTCLAGLMALGLVALAPDTASAGHSRGWGWGGGWGPGFGIYIGPGYHYRNYGYRPYYNNHYSYGYGPRWKHHHRHHDWN